MKKTTKRTTKTANKTKALVKKSVPKKQNRTTSAAGRTSGTVRKVPAKQVTKVSAEKGTRVTVSGKIFQGAKAIELTDKIIAVTHAASRSRQGVIETAERRRYVPQTPETVAAVNQALNEAQRKGKVKKVRIEFKR